MLTKLYKHELRALGRFLIPAWLILLGVAIIVRVAFIVDVDFFYFDMLRTSFSIVCAVSVIGIFYVAMALVISRFYKHLLTKEGYLTFTLPFTANQHICCKLICGMIAMILTSIVVCLSLLIIGIGYEFTADVFMFLGDALSEGYKMLGIHLPILIILFVILAIISIGQGLLTFYTAMCLGQSFHKNRIGGAVLWYFIIYCALQFITSILTTIIIVILDAINPDLLNALTAEAILYIIMIGSLLFSCILTAVFYMITKVILTKKLNLE